MAQPGYRDIIAAIKKGNPASVYLLMGEEDYYIDLIVNALEKSVKIKTSIRMSIME